MLALGSCGRMVKDAVDALSDSEANDRDAVFAALGKGIEDYMKLVLKQLVVVLPYTPLPTPGGPVPLPLPPGSFL